MKTYGSYYKFDSAVDFFSYFDKSYNEYYWNSGNSNETLEADIYWRILKKGEFPVFLCKELNDPDTRTVLGDYSLNTKRIGSLRGELASLRNKADALEDFLK